MWRKKGELEPVEAKSQLSAGNVMANVLFQSWWVDIHCPHQQKFNQLGWKTLEHQPYSADSLPCDFQDFGPLKEALEGQRFNVVAGVGANRQLAANMTDFMVGGWDIKAGAHVEK